LILNVYHSQLRRLGGTTGLCELTHGRPQSHAFGVLVSAYIRLLKVNGKRRQIEEKNTTQIGPAAGFFVEEYGGSHTTQRALGYFGGVTRALHSTKRKHVGHLEGRAKILIVHGTPVIVCYRDVGYRIRSRM
jgi:hypothetical protein